MAIGADGRALLAAAAALLAAAAVAAGDRASVEYTNQFAVLVPGGRARAERAADEHGCSLVDSIGDLTDHYLLECHSVHKRSTEQARHHTSRLMDSDEILWADQQYFKTRKKRHGGDTLARALDRLSVPFQLDALDALDGRGDGERVRLRSPQAYWPDPLYREQWYLNGGAKDGSDMNVIPAWQQGYSGKGVVVSILDDGIQPDHPDLAANYDSRASLDINDNDDDPTPRDDGTNRHGTRCAGEVAAVAGNTVCGVGVAPNASIGGVRMLDGGVNDHVEAKALSYRRNHIDIYSASWGPEDDGKTVDGPGPLARRAFIEGVLKGRGGKGSIFVWASGNGGQYVDNCNCDGYTNSIFTLSISSASQGGNKPWYLEECASTLATTYSSGTPLKDKSIATCDQDAALRPKHICTVAHTGTSASAPLAAGLCSLALEANPTLTWRDMQYIVLMTSRSEPLAKEVGWRTNGVGRRVSHKFGYGLMDAGAMVDLAKRWTSVPAQHICITPIDSRTRAIPTEYGGQLRVSMEAAACHGTPQTVNFLEHVQCKVTLTYVPRGNLCILLTSPAGTVTTLLFKRPRDVTGSSFDRWPFMSVHFWGENPRGVWNLTVINTDRPTMYPHTHAPETGGVLKEWQLILYGTEQEPIRLRPPPGEQPAAGAAVRASVVNRSGTSTIGLYCSRQCVHSCQTQPAGDSCKRCREQYKSDCKRSCDPGTFYSGESGCQPCHSSCGTCFGRLQNQCLDCAAGHQLITDLSVCVAACPDGYFNVNGTCESCGPHCTSCVGSSNHCLSCAPHLILHKNQCVASCPAGTYEVNERCELCSAGCETCVGPSDTNCVLCRSGLTHVDGQCVSACPPGSFRDAERGECLRCPLGCDSCTGALTCDACAAGWRPTGDGRCAVDRGPCTDGQFFGGGTCRPCHHTCVACSGPMSVECSRCQPATYLHNGLCYRDCPEGFSAVAGVCQPCLHTCQDCRSQESCSSCRPGLLMNNGTCVAACPQSTYRSLDDCLPCAPTCLTCFGPRPDECVSCHASWLLVAGSCHTSCPSGYFQTPAGCRRCHRTCRTCTGIELTSCSSCHEGYQLLSGANTCVPCGGREYFEPRAKVCRPCYETCGTCQGPGPRNCTSCAGELRLQLPQHRCLRCCDQQRPRTATPASCCPCDPSREHCVRGTRRRTADSYFLAPEPATSSFNWFYVQGAVWCVASLLLFGVVFTVLQCRVLSGRRHTPVLELADGDEHLALTDYQNEDHMDELSDTDEDHLVVFDSRT